jgi:hypothetical protein
VVASSSRPLQTLPTYIWAGLARVSSLAWLQQQLLSFRLHRLPQHPRDRYSKLVDCLALHKKAALQLQGLLLQLGGRLKVMSVSSRGQGCPGGWCEE